MAFKQESADPLDMDSFFNMDQAVAYPSPHSSAASMSRGKSIATPEFTAPNLSNVFLPPQQPTFSGPSHQYDNYKQQTGLPVGAVAKIPAVAQVPYGLYPGQSTQSTDYFGMNSVPFAGDDFDFNKFDMDLDYISPTTDSFASSDDLRFMNSGCIDPNAIGGREGSPAFIPAQGSVTRMWPGMHQQQAREQQQRQQQMRAMQQSQANGSQRLQSQSAASNSSRLASNPHVEETISRILKHGRQTSAVSSHDEEEMSSMNDNFGKSRKGDDDMDPDEKLLASDEGKKLSSKERRQLRNKVSARAFRSRRKDYITQLEEAAAAKAQESEELQKENDALKAENRRMHDLTNLLLAAPQFKTYMDDMAQDPAYAANALVPSQPSSTTQQQARAVRKDVHPRQQYHQGDAHVGFAFLPETNMDLSALQINDSWGSSMNVASSNNNTSMIFSVTSIPEGPTIDVETMSGKSTNFMPSFASDEAKDDLPIIERMPTLAELEEPLTMVEDVVFDKLNPAFALFMDQSAATAESTPAADAYQVFGELQLEKVFARVDLVVDDESSSEDKEVSAATMARFELICASMDAVSSRVACITSHL